MHYRDLKQKLEEEIANSTAIINYPAGFQVDTVPSDFDVEDYARSGSGSRPNDDEWSRDRKELGNKWEVENANAARERREVVLRWLKAASGNQLSAVNNKSIPMVPGWQSFKY